HAATIAEYAITVLLALAHRVPRMVEWQARGTWPPDKDRWFLLVPTEMRGSTLGIIGYGSIGRELARIAQTAVGMTVLACKCARSPPPPRRGGDVRAAHPGDRAHDRPRRAPRHEALRLLRQCRAGRHRGRG